MADMIHFLDWFKDYHQGDSRWLVLGKGPSFGMRDRVDLSDYTTVALNHAVAIQPVDIAHAIDIDVIDDCAHVLDQNARWLLMPLYPHVHCQYRGLTLKDFFASLPILQQFADEGRLLWYDLNSAPTPHSRPVARGTFSAAVVINLLAQIGVRTVETLGVDGGANYSSSFSDHTLLANQLPDFDAQFVDIANTVHDYGIMVNKAINPIRIFVGCDDTQLVAGKVLEFSIKKHTAHPVEVFFMNNMPTMRPQHKKNRPGTGFSFNRFLIPKLAGYSGKAIYLDADMLVFDDIEKLWNMPMNGHKVLCSVQNEVPRGWEGGKNNNLGEGRYWTPGRQMSVMLMDCERLDWDVEEIIRGLDEERYTYKDLMASFCILEEGDVGDVIPSTWNCLEWYKAGDSQLVHFTVVPTQPWKNDRNTLEPLWVEAYKEAVGAGAVPIDLIEDSVAKKYVKESLLVEALACERAPRADSGSANRDEASRLRRMLWDVMISDSENREELRRVSNSISWRLECLLIRRPFDRVWQDVLRCARFIRRAVRRGGEQS